MLQALNTLRCIFTLEGLMDSTEHSVMMNMFLAHLARMVTFLATSMPARSSLGSGSVYPSSFACTRGVHA